MAVDLEYVTGEGSSHYETDCTGEASPEMKVASRRGTVISISHCVMPPARANIINQMTFIKTAQNSRQAGAITHCRLSVPGRQSNNGDCSMWGGVGVFTYACNPACTAWLNPGSSACHRKRPAHSQYHQQWLKSVLC